MAHPFGIVGYVDLKMKLVTALRIAPTTKRNHLYLAVRFELGKRTPKCRVANALFFGNNGFEFRNLYRGVRIKIGIFPYAIARQPERYRRTRTATHVTIIGKLNSQLVGYRIVPTHA